jgi:hypothetical protein
MITELTPLHKVLAPSVVEILEAALKTPLYMA